MIIFQQNFRKKKQQKKTTIETVTEGSACSGQKTFECPIKTHADHVSGRSSLDRGARRK